MTELKNRVILGLFTIFVLGMIIIYMGSLKISLKLINNTKGTALVEITVTEFGVPTDSVVKVHLEKITFDGHNCKKMLTIHITGGKAVFKVWGKNGKASHVKLEVRSSDMYVRKPNKLSFEIGKKEELK